MHIRNPYKDSIPPHQDQFYHYCHSRDKVKILFSLTSLNKNNGFLQYYNPETNIIPLTNHTASSVAAFSSFISPEKLINKEQKWQDVNLSKHKIVLHFMDSIHRAQVNNTPSKCAFLVFRFDRNQDEIFEIKEKYKEVYDIHLKNIEKIDKR